MAGGTGRGKNGQRQQRRERRLTIDIRQIQGIYAPKTAWQKGMADRHPLLCVCSVFIGLILRDGVQIRLYIFGFLGPLGLDSGRFTTPFLKCVFSNFSKKTNNPNPSPIKKIWFGLYWFGFVRQFLYGFKRFHRVSFFCGMVSFCVERNETIPEGVKPSVQ